MHNLRASKQWFATLLSIVSFIVFVPSAMAATPTITKLIPAAVNAGWPSFTLTVEGTNFVAASKVYWAGHELATTFENAKELTALVPAALITAKGTDPVTVASGEAKSTGAAFTVEPPKPLIGSLIPAAVAPGGPQFALTINGADFVKGATTVKWENTATRAISTLATTFVSATELRATVTSALIHTAGTATVTVATTTGGTSAAATFASEPKPVLSSLSPTSAIAGNPAVTLTLTGSSFIAGSKVVWKTPTLTKTITLTGAELTATKITLPPTVMTPLLVNSKTTAIAATVTVTSSGGTSLAKPFQIEPVKPLIASLSPLAAAPGGPQFTLTINGGNFVKGATTVKWLSTLTHVTSTLTTTSVTATVIKATVTNALIKNAGTASVTVITAKGTSAAATFVFEAKPTISSLSPSEAIAGGPGLPGNALTIVGTNFFAPATVKWGNTVLTSTVLNTKEIRATVPATLLVNAGTKNVPVNVTVTTPEGASKAAAFTVEPAVPIITKLSPTVATAGGAAFTLTVTGYNFVKTAGATTVVFNGHPLVATVASATSLTVIVPTADFSTSGSVTVQVQTSKGTSNSLPFTIKSSGNAPVIGSLSPASGSITAGKPGFSLTINGSGFVQGATAVTWTGPGYTKLPLTMTSFSTTKLVATVGTNLVANAGTASVCVTTPGGTTCAPFVINPGAPTISNLSPNSITAGQTSNLAMKITGTGFTSTAKVTWTPPAATGSKPTTLTATFVNSTTLNATVLSTLLQTAGSASVTVTTSLGASAPSAFLITPPVTAGCTNDGSGNAELSGAYSFQFTQIDPTNNGEISYNVGAFTADGKGKITGGTQDSNGPYFASANENASFTGTYSVGSDSRGLLSLTYPGGAVANFCFALDSLNSGVAAGGRLVSDQSIAQIDSGSFHALGSTTITASTVAGSWTMGIEGIKLDPSNGDTTRGATAGYITLDGASKVTAGEADTSQDAYSAGKLTNSSAAQVGLTGTYTLASTGRGTLTLTYAGSATSHYVFYLAGTNQIFLLSTDTGGKGGSAVMAGRALLRSSSPFDNGTLSGSSVFIDQALSNTSATQYVNRLVQAGVFNWNGSGSYTETYDQNDAGTVSTLKTASSTYSVDSVGRVTINGTTPSIFGYLVDANEGFAVGGNLGVTAMYFENQATGGFNLADFTGNYSEGSLGYAFEDQQVSSGEFDANGAGSLTGEVDLAGGLGGCEDCHVKRDAGAAPELIRPEPRDKSVTETYAASSVASRFVVSSGSKAIQALYFVTQDKAYAIDIVSGDGWPPLEVFNHQ